MRSSINDIRFGPLSGDQAEMAKKQSTLIPLDVGDIDYKDPPLNNSNESKGELKYIAHVIENQKFEKQERERLDNDFVNLFFNYADKNNLDYNKKDISSLVEDFVPLILRLKEKYNRPRPYQLAEALGLDIEYNKIIQSESGSAHSPSYPSGHAAQAYLAAELLAKSNPTHRENLIGIAERVAMARIKEGVHFSSDNEFSKTLVRNYVMPALDKKVYLNKMSANKPYKYTAKFSEEIIATSKIESGEWLLSKGFPRETGSLNT